MQPRQIKGLEIAAKLKLVRKGNTWHVPSQRNKQENYTVALHDDKPQCTCRDYEFRSDKCKHIFAVEYTIEREQTADGQTVVTETVKVIRKTYPQNWPAYNAAQTHEKSELQALLYELCRSVPEPEQRMGRPRLSLADIIFSSTFKVYSTVSGRRFMSDLREAKARGFLAKLPSYNSVFRYLEAEVLTPYLFELIAISALPLKSVETKFAVDSSGFSKTGHRHERCQPAPDFVCFLPPVVAQSAARSPRSAIAVACSLVSTTGRASPSWSQNFWPAGNA